MKIEIIAEIAQGFEGNPEQAHLLLKAAAAAGASAAKYQMVYADELATSDYEHYHLFKTLEMPNDVWKSLVDLALDLGIELHIDIFGSKSLELCQSIGVKTVKLHGTDISNIGLLEKLAKSSIEKVLLGAGGAYISELEQALEVLSKKRVIILLGFQGYPTLTVDNQIARVSFLVEKFKDSSPNITIGFADHAEPNSPLRFALSATAVGAGATTIEKHLTLGRGMQLEDYESALNPDEFLDFTNIIRECAQSLGNFNKGEDFGMSTTEKNYRKLVRRHVVANHNLFSGDLISPSDLSLKRTSYKIFITDLNFTYKKVLRRDVLQNTPILPDDLL
jgi:N,N'-diacetyllegionaminate synthase